MQCHAPGIVPACTTLWTQPWFSPRSVAVFVCVCAIFACHWHDSICELTGRVTGVRLVLVERWFWCVRCARTKKKMAHQKNKMANTGIYRYWKSIYRYRKKVNTAGAYLSQYLFSQLWLLPKLCFMLFKIKGWGSSFVLFFKLCLKVS